MGAMRDTMSIEHTPIPKALIIASLLRTDRAGTYTRTAEHGCMKMKITLTYTLRRRKRKQLNHF